jgi:hypothetical protein
MHVQPTCMRTVFILCFLVAVPGASVPEASLSYFTHVRDVKVSAADRQNYIVVDQDIWKYARPDLADLRLHDGAAQVPYILREERGGTSSEEQAAKILNLGTASGHTEFDIDVGASPPYNRIRLQLDAKNFVATAQIEGRSDLAGSTGTQLGQSTLYDFTRENLGSNFFLQIPASGFRYLHVRLPAELRPEQVKGAAVYDIGEHAAAWTPVGWSPGRSDYGRQTTDRWQFSATVPVDRIHFGVAPDEANFRRTVSITDADGAQVTRDEISRIAMTRGGTTAVAENLDLDILGVHTRSLTITVENGDDAPLRGLTTQPLSIERRIYFDPQGKTDLKLYYGDGKLAAPLYDYARIFHESATATEARLSPDQPNPAYIGRPDDRAWSERHKLLFWGALLLVIIGVIGTALGAMGSGNIGNP